MGLPDLNRLFLKYQKASLPLKISVPFILMFLGFWVTSTAVVGSFFANKLEQDQQDQAAASAALVKRKILKELDTLRKEARLLSIAEPIIQATVSQNQNQLKKSLLPLRGILDTNLITVINQEKQPLFNIQNNFFDTNCLQVQDVNNLLIAGSDIATIVRTDNAGPLVLVGTAPIKSDQGVMGGILLGNILSDTRLIQINQSIKEQIVVLSGGVIVASTFPSKTDNLDTITFDSSGNSITIDNLDYFAQPIYLEGLGNEEFEMVLLISQQPLKQAKQALWLFIVLTACLGSMITTILGYWIAQKVARPIQDLTLIAQRVAGESRFDLRASADTHDDISILALSLNQLIEWVGQYTHELEIATQTLETRVEERTQKLSGTLHKLKETQAQLIQTEKMSSLGQMIAGIAHEINNPISFVQGNIDPLKEYFQDLLDLIKTYQTEYPDPTKAITQKQKEIDFEFLMTDLDKLLKSMNLGTERVHEIVQSLRNFSRLDEAIVKDVDIHEGIDSTLLILNHRIKHEVTVVKRYGDLPLVRCFPAQLNQVFTNIIVNSLDAMFDANRDSAGADSSVRKKLKIVTRMIGHNQVQIVICDSGPGIPRHIRKKIFDPFFTTKPVGKGTGLGLGICFRIIQQHQGTIRVRSKVGKGSEFVITLPINVLPAEPPMAIPVKVMAHR